MGPDSFSCCLANIPEAHRVGIPATTVEQIAAVWDDEVSRILQRMLAIGQEQRSFFPERGVAAYELVNIRLYLTPEIVKKHLSDRNLKDIDPVAERQALDSRIRRDRIENTARLLAEHIWIRRLDKWANDTLSLGTPRSRVLMPGGQRPPTTRNHYSPRFANRLWADSHGKVAVYTPSPGDELDVQVRDIGQWGFKQRLYSESLERYLGEIESAAAIPIRKILDVVPLTAMERKDLITFLIAQWLRTPVFILTQMSGLQKIIREQGIRYGTDIRSLRYAYESCFQNDALYSMLYRSIDSRSWRILVAPKDEGFVRPDSTIVATRTTNFYYPLTPTKCLHIGPDLAGELPPVIPLPQQLSSEQLARTNAILISFAFESAISSPQFDSPKLRRALARWFGSSRLVQQARRSLPLRYWGSLSRS